MVKRREIYYISLGRGLGSEQSGDRPCIIMQNNTGNKHSRTTVVALITTAANHKYLPVHVPISKEESGLEHDSIVLLEQLRTIDKCRLIRKVSMVSEEVMGKISLGLATSILSETGDAVSGLSICQKSNKVQKIA